MLPNMGTLNRLEFLLLALAGCINRHDFLIIEYLLTENQVFREIVGKKRLRLTDKQRRRLAAKGKLLGRRLLGEFASIVTPDTILRWQCAYLYLLGRARSTDTSSGDRRRRSSRIPCRSGAPSQASWRIAEFFNFAAGQKIAIC